MTIKDEVVERYVRYFIIPKSQVLDKSGYIYFNLTGNTPLFARQVIMPESFFIKLEKEVVKKIPNGAEMLYSAGKKFGFRFALMGNFLDRKQINDKELLGFIKIINKFIEGTYASSIESEVDLSVPLVKYKTKDFVVISKLGQGYFLPRGACAGMLAKIFADKDFETVITNVNGNLTEEVGGPVNELKKRFKNILSENNLKGLELHPDYKKMNEIMPLQSSKYSFMDLIKNKIFDYRNGLITKGNDRYFIFEISGLYLLEIEMMKNKISTEEIFNSAVESGRNMCPEGSKKPKEIADLMSSFGWGEIVISQKDKKIIVETMHFPWTKFYTETNFSIFRGFMSGMLSKALDRKVNLIKYRYETNQGYMKLIISE